ncbi:MAG TPA: TIGR01777 family oxidoreductase [Polyangiaceae bacterium]|nr:TIGR01777 family oxidoreductase [Polyangiaceae bacterium]
MRILLFGATGFVGRALVLRLRRDGHEVLAWVRDLRRAEALLGREVTLRGPETALVEAVAGADAVVNLAGAPILPQRWSAARRRTLVDSRVGLTDQIVRAIEAAPKRPRVLVNSSAVGYYGDRGDETLDEASVPGMGFLAELCVAWEAAAARAEASGVRVVRLRTGVVLGQGGGMLAAVLPLFRAGLGGRLGDGRQWLSFIHLDDLVELVATALVDERFHGAVNAVAPEPVTNRDFSDALAAELGTRARFSAPRAALALTLGEAASALLSSQRVVPRRALELGFAFRYVRIGEAVRDVVVPRVSIHGLSETSDRPEASAYLTRRPPRYELVARSRLDAPLDEVFAFFSRPENLGVMTPSDLEFRIEGKPGAMEAGARIDYKIRVGVLPFRWRTRIERHEPPARFVDAQERGPYRSWWHEHVFRADGQKTVMEDHVYYALGFGWLGRLAHRLFVASTLRRIFAYRGAAMRLRFGLSP